MHEGIDAWLEALRFGADVQRVVVSRLSRLAGGGPLAATEASRMVAEKVAAFGEAHVAVALAITSGSGFGAVAAKAYAPYRRTVRANRRRLGA